MSARNAERALLFIERKTKVKLKDTKIIKIKCEVPFHLLRV
jgi:hypothetical protein